MSVGLFSHVNSRSWFGSLGTFGSVVSVYSWNCLFASHAFLEWLIWFSLRSWEIIIHAYRVLRCPNLIVIIECLFNDHSLSFLERYATLKCPGCVEFSLNDRCASIQDQLL